MSRFRSSLRYKIALWMLVLSLGPLIIVSVIVLRATFTQLGDFSTRLREAESALRSDVVGRNLSHSAYDTASDIDNYLLERISEVRRWSESEVVIEAAREATLAAQQSGLTGLPPDDVQEQLQGMLFVPITQTIFSPALTFVFQQAERAETPFVEVIATEASGINVLVTRVIDQVVHSEEGWWQDARTQGVGGIGITGAHLDESGVPVIGVALPVFDPNSKEVLGVIRALVRLTELQHRLSQKALSMGSDVRVFTPDGQLLADTRSDHSPVVIMSNSANALAENDTPALLALEAKPGSEGAGFVLVDDDADSRDIVGYAQTSGSEFYDKPAHVTDFDGFGWGVTVAQPEERALKVLANLIETDRDFAQLPKLLGSLFAVVLVLAGVLALIGAIVLSGSITKPLIELSHTAERVQEGDLTATVDVRSHDEVGVLGQSFNTMTAGLRERERERDIFGRVVSPEVREKLLDGALDLGGETIWIATLFSDIRNFSTTSEQMSPQEVVTFLNEYLSEMTDAIRPWGGYINNFIGDAIVAIFGAPVNQPDKEFRAVSAALAMRKRLGELNQRRVARGEAPIDNGVGIGTGEAVAGQIGSLERLMYTVIGDSVNVAARLESLTKDYPEHPILINGPTAEALKGRDDLHLKSLGPLAVKGRVEPVDVYAVLEK